jgi:hypothetical protein
MGRRSLRRMQMRELRGDRQCLMALRLMPMIGYGVCVERMPFMFEHVVVEFVFCCVGAVLFEAALRAMWRKCG